MVYIFFTNLGSCIELVKWKFDTGIKKNLSKFRFTESLFTIVEENHFNFNLFGHCVTFLQLREIRHENLNAFIGACQYEDGLLLVNEYCSRGSIKDILENGDLKLDDMFISSLVGDLLRVSDTFF